MRLPVKEWAEPGTALPRLRLPLTPTLIVSTAPVKANLASLQREAEGGEVRRSKDLSLTLLSTMGLVERYVTDWAGPEALIRGLNVRLGVPACAGDTLTFSGSVAAWESGEFTVRVLAEVGLGEHAWGTVRFTLLGR